MGKHMAEQFKETDLKLSCVLMARLGDNAPLMQVCVLMASVKILYLGYKVISLMQSYLIHPHCSKYI